MERIIPPLRNSLIHVRLPRIQRADGVRAIAQRVLSALSRGEITPNESVQVATAFGLLARARRESGQSVVPVEPKAVLPDFLVEALLANEEEIRRRNRVPPQDTEKPNPLPPSI